MTADVFARIQNDDMITIRTDGAVSYDSRLVEPLITAGELDDLLTIVQDNICTAADEYDPIQGEVIHWPGVERDAKVAGILEVS